MRYYLSLGSNIGKKERNLARARRLLERSGIRIVRSSSVYRTEPVGMSRQPWFVNQVIEIATALRPQGLLRLLKKAEKDLGRRPGPVNGPRPIDLDILLAGERVVKGKGLVIPHPRLAQRNFVLVPLEEIAPRTIHPLFKKTVSELCRVSEDTAVVRRLRPRRVASRRTGPGGGEVDSDKARTGKQK
jgi:2-amino-4-hydroxy-6-hydroxymethyldihydropteridine diphosphokinase